MHFSDAGAAALCKAGLNGCGAPGSRPMPGTHTAELTPKLFGQHAGAVLQKWSETFSSLTTLCALTSTHIKATSFEKVEKNRSFCVTRVRPGLQAGHE